jgi:hypothetical protein
VASSRPWRAATVDCRSGCSGSRWRGAWLQVPWRARRWLGVSQGGGERGIRKGGRGGHFSILPPLLSRRRGGGELRRGGGVQACWGARGRALWPLVAGWELGWHPGDLLPARCSTKFPGAFLNFFENCQHSRCANHHREKIRGGVASLWNFFPSHFDTLVTCLNLY